jgi:hypothetical protein
LPAVLFMRHGNARGATHSSVDGNDKQHCLHSHTPLDYTSLAGYCEWVLDRAPAGVRRVPAREDVLYCP